MALYLSVVFSVKLLNFNELWVVFESEALNEADVERLKRELLLSLM